MAPSTTAVATRATIAPAPPSWQDEQPQPPPHELPSRRAFRHIPQSHPGRQLSARYRWQPAQSQPSL